jgi:hypothetical protein
VLLSTDSVGKVDSLHFRIVCVMPEAGAGEECRGVAKSEPEGLRWPLPVPPYGGASRRKSLSYVPGRINLLDMQPADHRPRWECRSAEPIASWSELSYYYPRGRTAVQRLYTFKGAWCQLEPPPCSRPDST